MPQPQVQQGPTTRRTVRRSASWMENLGRKGCQVCNTWPMVVPGGAWTSIWSGRQTGSLPSQGPAAQALTSQAVTCLPSLTSHPTCPRPRPPGPHYIRRLRLIPSGPRSVSGPPHDGLPPTQNPPWPQPSPPTSWRPQGQQPQPQWRGRSRRSTSRSPASTTRTRRGRRAPQHRRAQQLLSSAA